MNACNDLVKINRWALIVSTSVCITLMTFTGCDTIKESSKYQFNEGYYHSALPGEKKKQVAYVVPEEDTIKVYYSKNRRKNNIDIGNAVKIAFSAKYQPLKFENILFKRSTFDIDVLSVLFKYRFPVHDFPAQFNTTFNGALYIGYRTDIYRLSYEQSPVKTYKRKISHYGYSAGVFSGLGTARIDEYVTRNNIDIQYDGMINLFGLAGIIAVNKLSFGLTAGVDNLLDKNKKYWVNQMKPWIGLSVGLNLN